MRTKTFATAVLLILTTLPAAAAALSLPDLLSLRQACGNDIKSLCPDMSPGDGRIMQCMMVHASSVSAGCAAMLKAEKAKFPATTMGMTLYDTD